MGQLGQIILGSDFNGGRLSRVDVGMLEAVFQNLPDIFYYAKDVRSRWVSCNAASLELLNLSRIDEVVGASERDFFPPQIARAIRFDDTTILRSGKSIMKRIELIPNADGLLMWVSTNKQPIISQDGTIVGLVGTTSPVPEGGELPQQFEHFRQTISHIRANLGQTIKIADLAQAVRLSESQFRRNFRVQFGVSPQEFILRARLQSAARALSRHDTAISAIAGDCGFTDQSYFTRQFKDFFGETPRRYRLKWRT